MYKPYEIFYMLKQAAIIVGESKTPDDFAYMDVLFEFLRLEKCVYHHSAKQKVTRFHGMPYGVYPYKGVFGVGYIVSYKNVIDYYLKGG